MDRPYFKFYPADWLADSNVEYMTLEERGAYIHLLAHMWREDGVSLPNDDKFLARLLHISTRKWNKLREIFVDGEHAVLVLKDDGRLHNNRLDKEFVGMVDKSKKGAMAANTRWEKEKSSDANAMQTHEKRNASAVVVHMQNDAISDSDLDSDLDPERDLKTSATSSTSANAIEMQKLVKMYESEGFGHLSLIVSQHLQDLLNTYTFAWVSEAMKEAVLYNRRSLKYVESILSSWKTAGGPDAARAQREAASTQIRGQPNRNTGRPAVLVSEGANVPSDQRYSNFYKLFPDG